MKKTVVLTAAFMAAMAVTAFAAPMGSTELGDVRVDLNYGFSQDVGPVDGDSGIVGGDVTVGLGGNWAFQYENYTVGIDFPGADNAEEHHFRALYKLTPNVGVFAGVTHANIADGDGNPDSTGFQAGVVGQIDLTDDVFAWGSVGLGNDINTYELGVGYNVTPQLDVHVLYRESSHDYEYVDDDIKGWQVGLGYQF